MIFETWKLRVSVYAANFNSSSTWASDILGFLRLSETQSDTDWPVGETADRTMSREQLRRLTYFYLMPPIVVGLALEGSGFQKVVGDMLWATDLVFVWCVWLLWWGRCTLDYKFTSTNLR